MIAVNRSLDVTPIWGHERHNDKVSTDTMYESIPDPPNTGRRLVSADITRRMMEHCQVPNLRVVVGSTTTRIPSSSSSSSSPPPTWGSNNDEASSTFMLYTSSNSPQFVAALQRMRGGANLQKLKEARDKMKKDTVLSHLPQEAHRTGGDSSSSSSSSADSPEKGLTTTTVTLGRRIEGRSSGTARSA